MTQTWWGAVRYAATAVAAALTSVQQYYPEVHWIGIAVLTLAILGFHVMPTAPPMYKMMVTPTYPPGTYSSGTSGTANPGQGGGGGGSR